MHRTRTTSSGATYVASAAPAPHPPGPPKHYSSTTTTTTYSPPDTASTVSAAQYTKPPSRNPAAPRLAGRGGTPAAPGASATGAFGTHVARDGEDEAQFTFYREGTPTPSDHRSVETRWEKTGRRVSTRMGGVLSSVGFPAVERGPEAGSAGGRRAWDGGGDGGGSWGGDGDREGKEEGRGRRGRRICGVPAGMFWCLAIGVGMLVVGLAVGLGLGLGLKSDGGGDAASATEPSASATPTPTTPTTPSLLPTTFDTSGLPTTTKIDCPDSDGHLYLAPGTTPKPFLVRCGIDYSSDAGPAAELGQALASDMEECVAHCAAAEGCTACGWGFVEGDDEGDRHRCWLKGRLSTEHRARANWTFAIMQGGGGGGG